MKSIIIKIITSIISLAIVFAAIRWVSNYDQTLEDGFVHVTIVDGDGITVFEDELEFFKSETFYDVLKRSFNLTCANASYQADQNCSYSFQGLGYQGKVILGISNDEFTLLTDWYNSFLAFEKQDGEDYHFSTSGPSHMILSDGLRFRISVKDSWGG